MGRVKFLHLVETALGIHVFLVHTTVLRCLFVLYELLSVIRINWIMPTGYRRSTGLAKIIVAASTITIVCIVLWIVPHFVWMRGDTSILRSLLARKFILLNLQVMSVHLDCLESFDILIISYQWDRHRRIMFLLILCLRRWCNLWQEPHIPCNFTLYKWRGPLSISLFGSILLSWCQLLQL